MHSRMALALAALLSAVSLPAQDRSAESAIPASSFVCLQFAGLDACRAGTEQLGMIQFGHRLMASQAAAPYRARLEQELTRALPRMHRHLQQVGLDAQLVRGMLARSVAVGVGRPTIFGGQPMPSIALVFDVSQAGDAPERMGRLLEGMLTAKGIEVSRQSRDYHGVSATVFAAERHSGNVCIARVGDLMILTNSTGYLAECVGSARGEVAGIATTAGFETGRQRLGATPLLSVFLNTPLITGIPAPLLPYEVTSICDALGTSGLSGVFYGNAVHGGASLDVCHLGIQGSAKGVLRSALGRPASMSAARLCPPETLLFATGSLDVNALADSCQRLFAALPTEVRREIEREALREIERELGHVGMTLEQLVGAVGSFGPEISLAVTTPLSGAMLQPEILAVIDVTDEERARQMLHQALAHAPELQLEQAQFGGTEFVYTNTLKREIPGMPYAPAIAIHGGKLLVASTPQSLKAALRRFEGEDNSLATRADFQAAASKCDGASMFACAFFRDQLPSVWGAVQPYLESFLLQHDKNFDLALLPTAEELGDVLSDSVVSLTVDDHGLTTREEHAIGGGAAVAGIGAILDHVLRMPPPAAESTAAPETLTKKKIY